MVAGFRRPMICLLVMLAGADAAVAQFNEFRGAATVSPEQKTRIGAWLGEKLAKVEQGRTPEAARSFLTEVDAEWRNSANSLAFVDAMAEQTANLAKAQFAKPDLDGTVGMALAVALSDMNSKEAWPAFLVGLESPLQSVRYVSARGLVARMKDFSGDAKQRAEVIAAVKKAAVKETNGFILQHMYKAIAFPALDPEAFGTFLAVFDARLQVRRAGAQAVDPGEIEAFDYFAQPAILGALDQAKKVELASRLAVFLRMHAQRFGAGNVGSEEFFFIGAGLSANETILSAIVVSGGGNIQGVLGAGAGAAVMQEAVRWVGDAATQTKGVLNDAPWSVPIGAP